MPNVVARKGPDVNGADIEIEFETGLNVIGLQKKELCAVQVKAYEKTMGYDKAIKDIQRAFDSNPEYTCGLIVSTSLQLSADFEKKLEALREKTKKNVGILIGRDLAFFIIKNYLSS